MCVCVCSAPAHPLQTVHLFKQMLLDLLCAESSCCAGDTHGIVEDDWATLRWDKLNYLLTLGVTPWYAQGRPSAGIESYDYEDGAGERSTARLHLVLPWGRVFRARLLVRWLCCSVTR